MTDQIVVFGFGILFLYTITAIVIVGLLCLWVHWRNILPNEETDVEET